MTPEQWNQIRRGYEELTPEILKQSALGRRVDPYFVDWAKLFTPIEYDAWVSIRGYGAPLYPQFPVANCFIDFASPYHKIGLELDGKDFHEFQRDYERDLRLLEHGWKIFRIPGREARLSAKSPAEFEEWQKKTYEFLEETAKWLQSSDGVIKALQDIYFKPTASIDARLRERYLTSLRMHTLVDFDIS